MEEIEMLAKEVAKKEYLVCTRCGNKKVNVLWILSIWWNVGICEECIYKFADKRNLKVIGDQRPMKGGRVVKKNPLDGEQIDKFQLDEYQPHPLQRRFHESNKKYLFIPGGYRPFVKTDRASIEACIKHAKDILEMNYKVFHIELDAFFLATNIDEAFSNLARHFQNLANNGNADPIFLSESHSKIRVEYETIEEYNSHKKALKT